jgi:hypothetical protein
VSLKTGVQCRKVARDRLPHDREIDAEVFVHEQIAHVPDIAPRDIRKGLFDFRADVPGGLSDHLDVAYDRVHRLAIVSERSKSIPATYALMFVTASRMSSSRMRPVLRGTDCLAQNLVA